MVYKRNDAMLDYLASEDSEASFWKPQ